jgi:hypothetical protein
MCRRGTIEFWRLRKLFFGVKYGLRDFILLFLVELVTCLQNLIPSRGMEHWEKNYFPQEGMLKFTYKDSFLTIKKSYKKLVYWKSKWGHTLVPPLHVEFFFARNKKSQILVVNFWWFFISGVVSILKLIVFGLILAKLVVLGKFYCIDSGWEHVQSKTKIIETFSLINYESKSYIRWLIGILPSTTSKTFKMSKNLLQS